MQKDLRWLPEFKVVVKKNLDFCIQGFKRKCHGKDLAGKQRVILQLLTQCVRAKRTFPSSTQTTIETVFSFEGIDYLVHCLVHASRALHGLLS